MTTLDLDSNSATYQIRAFQPGAIQVNDKILNKSILITPHTLDENWPPQSIDELTAQALSLVIPLKPNVLLIGTGSELIFLDISLYGELINHGIGVEIMDTRAACRTFNALAAEDRHVVAALIIK